MALCKEAEKVGKASQDAYNGPFEKLGAEGVASEVNDFIPDANQATWLKETCKVSQVASFSVF